MASQTLRGRARSWFGGTRAPGAPALSGRLRATARTLARRLLSRPGPGRGPLRARQHTVLLGWSDALLAVLPALVEPGPDQRRGCLAVLADRDPAAMAGQLRARAAPHPRTRVVCRAGDPADPDRIGRLNPQQAGSVIVWPAAATPAERDAQLVAGLLAVARAGAVPARVVGCLSDPANLPAARLAGGPEAHLVDEAGLAARLIGQTCREPGLPLVYGGLLDPTGERIQVRAEPALVGHTYGQAVHAYRTAAVIGLRTGDGGVTVNPHSQTPIRPGDQLVAICPAAAAMVPAPAPAPVAQPAIAAQPDPPQGRTRTLVLGWNGRAARLLYQLDHQLPPGSEVSVVARHPGAGPGLDRLTGRLPNLVLTFKADDGADRAVLESLGVGSYDHVVVLADDPGDGDHRLTDARTLTTQLHLRDLAQRPGTGRFSVVCELADHRHQRLARVTGTEDVVSPGQLAGLLVARIAGDPTRAAVFASLFDPEGAALHLKPAERYVMTGQPVNFQTVAEAARWRWETALGYRQAARSGQPPGYGLVLNPDKAAPLTLQPGDQVIVLADA